MLGNIILLKSSVIFLEKQGTLLISFWRNTKISLIYFNVVVAVFFNNKYYEFKSSISVDQKHAYFHILAVLKELSNFWEAHKMWERSVKMQILGLAQRWWDKFSCLASLFAHINNLKETKVTSEFVWHLFPARQFVWIQRLIGYFNWTFW